MSSFQNQTIKDLQFCFNCIIIITSPFYLTFTIKIITSISCCSLHFRNRRCFYNLTSRSTPFSSSSNFTNKILHRFFFIISCFTLLKHHNFQKNSFCMFYVCFKWNVFVILGKLSFSFVTPTTVWRRFLASEGLLWKASKESGKSKYM